MGLSSLTYPIILLFNLNRSQSIHQPFKRYQNSYKLVVDNRIICAYNISYSRERLKTSMLRISPERTNSTQGGCLSVDLERIGSPRNLVVLRLAHLQRSVIMAFMYRLPSSLSNCLFSFLSFVVSLYVVLYRSLTSLSNIYLTIFKSIWYCGLVD